MPSVENVATPPTTATVRAPSRLAPAAPVPVVISTVTLPENPVAVLPQGSRAVTTTAGAIASPAIAAVGCVVNTSRLAAAGETANAVLVLPVRPPPPPLPPTAVAVSE